jgi:hypothetical protein
MATQVQRVEKVTRPVDSTEIVEEQRTVANTNTVDAPGNVLARVIGFLGSILLVLLAFRFVLVLLGANPANGFANFIYTASHPFVAPFFSLFGYNLRYGVSRVELGTLVAIVVYALITYGLMRLVTINRPRATTTY